MRIVNVVSVLAPIGGIESALVPLALELHAREHDVCVYVLSRPSRPNQNVDPLEQAGIEILSPSRLSLRVARLGRTHGPRVAARVSMLATIAVLPLLVARAVRRRRPVRAVAHDARSSLWRALARRRALEGAPYARLARALRRNPPAVVHVHGWGCGEDPAGALRRLRRLGFPLVYTEYGNPDARTSPPIPDAPMNLADVVVAISEAGREGLVTVGGADQPVRLSPCIVDPLPCARPAARRGDFVVTCVARLASEKGHLDLLEAFARVHASCLGARLVLAGAGPVEDELRARTRELGLEAEVVFLGPITREAVAELLASTDVVALASTREALGVALVEALAAGRPIVTTDTGGGRELVRHGENGLLVPIGDVDALAAALLELASDPERRGRMGAASAALFAQGAFTRAAVADGHLEAYRLAVARQRGRSRRGERP